MLPFLPGIPYLLLILLASIVNMVIPFSTRSLATSLDIGISLNFFSLFIIITPFLLIFLVTLNLFK